MSEVKMGGMSTDAGWTPSERQVLNQSSNAQEETRLPKGTPKSLREAINDGLMAGPLKDCEENVYLAVKDFLAQRFGAALLHADIAGFNQAVNEIEALFISITKG